MEFWLQFKAASEENAVVPASSGSLRCHLSNKTRTVNTDSLPRTTQSDPTPRSLQFNSGHTLGCPLARSLYRPVHDLLRVSCFTIDHSANSISPKRPKDQASGPGGIYPPMTEGPYSHFCFSHFMNKHPFIQISYIITNPSRFRFDFEC